MQKKTEKAIAILLAIGTICFLAFYLLQSYGAYKFEYVKENVSFVSNEAKPGDLMQEFNLNDTIFLSPEASDGVNSENALMSAASNLLQVVFIGNDKNVVSLWRVFDAKGNLVSCQTNNGDVQKNIELTAKDCDAILQDENNAIILISGPRTDKKSVIVFSQNHIEIMPDSIDNVSKVSFVFLKAMYANAELIINKTNLLTKLVK